MDEVRMKELSKLFFKIIIICIGFYLVFIHLGKIGNALLWIIQKMKPFIIGFIIAVTLNIPLNMIEKMISKRGIKNNRIISIILSLLSTLGIIIIIFVLILPELYHALKLIMDILFETLNKLAYSNGELSGIYSFLSQLDINWLDIKNKLEVWIESSSGELMNQMILIFKNTASSLVTFFIALIFSVYILANKEILKRQTKRLLSVWCNNKINYSIIYISNISINIFNQFIIGQVTEAIILGVLCGIGMAILQIPYALMMGVFIGVTALIPYFGAILGEVVGFVLISAIDPFKALIYFVFVLILQQIEGNFIYPKVVGNRIHLAPIWVFFSVIFGANVAGPLGMFFSVPLASILYTLLKEATNQREEVLRVRDS